MKKLLLLLCLSIGFLNAQETITLYITDGNDDAYQLWRDPSWSNPTGEMFVDADKLFVGHSWDPVMYYQIGLRYESVPIPPKSEIQSVYIQFYSFEANNDTTGIRVYCERNANPLPFTSTDYNISDREKTNHNEYWVASEWQAFIPGPNQRTHNIRGIVQEVVDMDGWIENNSLVLLFKGTNPGFGEDYPKAACSWEFGGEFYAPVLTITYIPPTSINEYLFAKEISIYPNPVNNNFKVSCKELKKGKYNFCLYTIQGQRIHVIHDGYLKSGNYEFNLSKDALQLKAGVYFLIIESEKHSFSGKIIIQN